MQILRAAETETHGDGDFQIRRVRPGKGTGPDQAYGALSAFDHATLKAGKVVKMHEHRNDEILTYMWRGTMVHEDSAGHRVPVSATNLMMMNAGESFWHEETAPEDAELLQIFVRPREADLPAKVAFFERPEGVPSGDWTLVAAPEGVDAPLTFRNAVRLYDARLEAGQQIDVPAVDGLSPFLFVIDGEIEIGGERLAKGDAARDADGALPPVKAVAASSLALFLVDRGASASKAGTISGH